MSRTLAIIKPDAVASAKGGRILAHLEDAGFTIRAMKLARLDQAEARAFYVVHEGRPFYDELVAFMTSGPVIPIVLDAENAVPKLREVIGATDPAEAEDGTIRRLYAESKGRNAIHASDSDENAEIEIGFFFSTRERLRLEG